MNDTVAELLSSVEKKYPLLMCPLASATTTLFATLAVADGVNPPTVPELPLTEPVMVAETVNPVNVPTDVKLLAVTPDASVAPVRVPAGAMTAAVVILVVKPLALIVTTGIAVLEPVVPAVATVAKVPAAVTFPAPVKLGEV